MIDRLITRAAALGLAAVFTALMLGGIDTLAGSEAAKVPSTELVAVQHVVITGHRPPTTP